MRISDWSSDVGSADLGSGQAEEGSSQRGARLLAKAEGDLPQDPDHRRSHGDLLLRDGSGDPAPGDGDPVRCARLLRAAVRPELGQPPCREQVCQHAYISMVSVYLKKTRETLNK